MTKVQLIMRLFIRGSGLALWSVCLLGIAGCVEDNEAAMRQQAANAKRAIPGSRTAQAQDLGEYRDITPGLGGAGSRIGPRPDQGAGYPDPKATASANSMWRLARPRADQGGGPGVKR